MIVKVKKCETYSINIWITGKQNIIEDYLRRRFINNPSCVTVTPTNFIYCGGQEDGVIIGIRNYPRFPKTEDEICIKAGTRPGDVVLNPFCGAGTTGLVAQYLQRKFIGIDISPKFCGLFRDRISKDMPLFNFKAQGANK
jgi:SAM-dependent methyltransferase